jgi:hypothetical protein
MVYQHLCRVGKTKTVPLIACIRKLLTMINTMLKHRRPCGRNILSTLNS